MKVLNIIVVSTVATIISFGVFADQNHKSGAPNKLTDNTTQSMLMMGSGQANMPMTIGNQANMPMTGGNQGGMGMMQNMQQRQAMMQTHMAKMETHMANIEASLKELVEQQKSN